MDRWIINGSCQGRQGRTKGILGGKSKQGARGGGGGFIPLLNVIQLSREISLSENEPPPFPYKCRKAPTGRSYFLPK